MMNWVFWALLIVGLILLFAPFFGIVPAAASAALWLLGGLLVIAAIVWAVVSLSQAAPITASSTLPPSSG